VKKQQIVILVFGGTRSGFDPQSTALETSTLNITTPIWFELLSIDNKYACKVYIPNLYPFGSICA